jgi:hypothetical protein
MTTEPAVTTSDRVPQVVLPAPTAWPIVMAMGIGLVFAGLVTSGAISILGAILAIRGAVGWFSVVLPEERVEIVLADQKEPLVASPRGISRAERVAHEPHRARVPVEVYPVKAGIKGGVAGGVVMAILAVIYGVLAKGSIWYPVNLLSAGFFPGRDTPAELLTFRFDSFVVALAIHIVTSLLVGLLYGAMLPMVPRSPVLLGGIVAPLLWSLLLYSVLEFIDPVLNRAISWPWFVLTQVGFGVVAGLVVSKQQRVPTWQHKAAR